MSILTFTNRDLICGVHALRTRDLLHSTKKSISLLDATDALETTRASAQGVMEYFQQAGYLELVPDDPGDEVWKGPSWQFVKGPKGKLPAPRYPYPLTCDEAKTAIGHFHDAVCSVNADGEFRAVSIDEVLLFGEALYCSNNPHATPIYRMDVAVKVVTKADSTDVLVTAQEETPRVFDRLQEGQTHLCLFRIGARRELIVV